MANFTNNMNSTFNANFADNFKDNMNQTFNANFGQVMKQNTTDKDMKYVSRIAYVELLSSKWQGSKSPYYQIVDIDGVTANTQVDLTPDAEMLEAFRDKEVAFVTENESGIVAVKAIGKKPQNDYKMQVTLTEVIR